ncbi:MAG: GcrA family cell cycle regulator [Thalassobaculum sp.]|uniref:GcrA family cell cycle regulator n=1 Tax=Thalassobaculum sp. TaxID=2022740 RepID=UPI0032ED64EF
MSDIQPSVWTEDRLTDLTRLWGEGLSITQIGLVLGVSRNAVVGKVHRMGLPKRQSPIVKSDKPRMPKAPIQRRRAVPLSLEQWDRNTCSWPTGDPKTDNFSFCGDTVEPGRPYCTAHCAKAYTTQREHAA